MHSLWASTWFPELVWTRDMPMCSNTNILKSIVSSLPSDHHILAYCDGIHYRQAIWLAGLWMTFSIHDVGWHNGKLLSMGHLCHVLEGRSMGGMAVWRSVFLVLHCDT